MTMRNSTTFLDGMFDERLVIQATWCDYQPMHEEHFVLSNIDQSHTGQSNVPFHIDRSHSHEYATSLLLFLPDQLFSYSLNLKKKPM